MRADAGGAAPDDPVLAGFQQIQSLLVEVSVAWIAGDRAVVALAFDEAGFIARDLAADIRRELASDGGGT